MTFCTLNTVLNFFWASAFFMDRNTVAKKGFKTLPYTLKAESLSSFPIIVYPLKILP